MISWNRFPVPHIYYVLTHFFHLFGLFLYIVGKLFKFIFINTNLIVCNIASSSYASNEDLIILLHF